MMTASPMMNPTYSAEPTDNALHAPQPTSTDAKPENRWAKAWGRERQLAETTLRECGNTHASALRVLVGCLWTWDTVLVVLSAVLGIAFFNNYKYVARPNGIPPRYLMDGWIGAIGRAVRCPKSNNTRALYREHGMKLAANLSWSFFSLAVVFPITYRIQRAYARRDQALAMLADVKSLIENIYRAHRDWNWLDGKGKGRHTLPEDYVAQVRSVLIDLTRGMAALLRVPIFTRMLHRYTSDGRLERQSAMEAVEAALVQVELAENRLSVAVEYLKSKGMPANEAARINQYHYLMRRSFDTLRHIKVYRNPEEIRAFSIVLVCLQPFLYGPYYIYVAQSTSVGFAVLFALFCGFITVGLLTMSRLMEDPFNEQHVDGVRVSRLFAEVEYSLHATLEGAEQWLAGGNVSATALHHGHVERGAAAESVYDPVMHPFDSHYDIGR